MNFKKYLNESDYAKQLIAIFNKAVRDELSACSVYRIIGNKLKGPDTDEIRDHLFEHAKEEYGHYTELIDYASKHNFLQDIKVQLDNTVFNANGDNNALVLSTQNLETKAAQDYRNASILASKNNDIETHEFFTELMKDELKHFDENAYFLGQSRTV